MFIYENHLYGGLYTSNHKLSWEELYCEQCEDHDQFIGEFDSAVELLKHLADEIDANDGYGGYAIESLIDDLRGDFKDVPTLNQAINIVKKNRRNDEDV